MKNCGLQWGWWAGILDYKVKGPNKKIRVVIHNHTRL